MKILITGGAGFIGSHFVRLCAKKGNQIRIVDKMTYAGNMDNLSDIIDDKSVFFIKLDICCAQEMKKHLNWADTVVNFAAETHVDRSIVDPSAFVNTDIIGSFTLFEGIVKSPNIKKIVQISTDEVYGSIEMGSFTEESPLMPRSPYAASKAGADLLGLAYHATFNMPIVITRSSNNYGPNQYPEKLIPFFITKALNKESLPLYGDGKNVRDWLFVEDNCKAIYTVMEKGEAGQIYNIGADCEKQNIEIAKKIVDFLNMCPEKIKFVEDRKGHDRRYSLNSQKIQSLGWKPEIGFEEGMDKTIKWYLDNKIWWEKILKKDLEYKKFMKENYKGR